MRQGIRVFEGMIMNQSSILCRGPLQAMVRFDLQPLLLLISFTVLEAIAPPSLYPVWKCIDIGEVSHCVKPPTCSIPRQSLSCQGHHSLSYLLSRCPAISILMKLWDAL